MTIEEAIQHCKEAAKANRDGALGFAREHNWGAATACKACAQEHDQLAELLTELKNRRIADVNTKPIIHAWWIDNDGMYTCSACGSEYGVMMNYCGECGCRMDGDTP